VATFDALEVIAQHRIAEIFVRQRSTELTHECARRRVARFSRPHVKHPRFAISRRLRSKPLLYFIALARLMTFRSAALRDE
jgi:hypothetical protein